MSNTTFEPNDKSLAEKQLMEELERGDRSGDEEGCLDEISRLSGGIEKSNASIGHAKELRDTKIA